MTDAEREYNGQVINNLCKLGEEVLKAAGVPLTDEEFHRKHEAYLWGRLVQGDY